MMRKIGKHICFLMLLMCWGVTSCTIDDEGSLNPFKKSVSFTFTMPESTVNTRGIPAEDGENYVNDLTLLFFKPSQNGTGKFMGFHKIPDNQLPVGNSMQFTVDVNSMDGLSISEAYSILAMGNMIGNYFTDSDELTNYLDGIADTETEDDIIKNMVMRIRGAGRDETNEGVPMDMKNLPMSAKGSKAEKESNVPIQLIRAVSRFDVINNANGYVIESVSIWNAALETGVWGDYQIADVGHTERFYRLKMNLKYDPDSPVDPNDPDPNESKVSGGLYAFENISISPKLDDTKTTCLIFGIKPVGGDKATYYRLNINSKDRGQYLKRNNAYQVTITGVLGEGAGTEYDACVKGEFLLEGSINSWDRDEDGLIIRDGNNMLAIPTRKAVFSPKAEKRQYYVYTLGKGELEIDASGLPAGITAHLDGNDLHISVTDYDLDQRKGSIILKFAGMSGVIEVVQSGKEEKFLTLSHTKVPVFPAGSANWNALTNSPITITSSGTWTAQIYNMGEDIFSFEPIDLVDVISGSSGHEISTICNIMSNSEKKVKTAFVLITLDADEENHRNVLILTQEASGKFLLEPNNSDVIFDPDMTLKAKPGNTNEFKVTTYGESDTWRVELLGAHHDKFDIVSSDGTTVITGKNQRNSGEFTIVPKGENYFGTYSATARIIHNDGANTKDITITQEYYGLTVTVTGAPIPTIGGTADMNVRLEGAAVNMTWSATISGTPEAEEKGLKPRFLVNGQLVQTLSGQKLDSDVVVSMSGIDRHLSESKATIVVTLDGTNGAVQKTITIQQNSVKYTAKKIQLTRNAGYNWIQNQDRAREFLNVVGSANNFSPTGTVYTAAPYALNTSASSTSYTDAGFVLVTRSTTGYRDDIISSGLSTKLENDQHLVVATADYDDTYARRNLAALKLDGFYTVRAELTLTSEATRRTVTTDTKATATQIYKYIFEEGPFGKVTVDNVSILGYAASVPLTSWPDTFIPLLYSGEYVMFGIDPVNRFVYMADPHLFARITTATTANYEGADKEDNRRFVRNFAAWVAAVNNYGKPFNDRFKDDRCR